MSWRAQEKMLLKIDKSIEKSTRSADKEVKDWWSVKSNANVIYLMFWYINVFVEIRRISVSKDSNRRRNNFCDKNVEMVMKWKMLRKTWENFMRHILSEI